MDEETKTQVKDEAKKTIRQSLDMQHEQLQRKLQQTVYSHQHNEGASTVDIENAQNALKEFQNTRAMKEVALWRKIDSGEADSTNE